MAREEDRKVGIEKYIRFFVVVMDYFVILLITKNRILD